MFELHDSTLVIRMHSDIAQQMDGLNNDMLITSHNLYHSTIVHNYIALVIPVLIIIFLLLKNCKKRSLKDLRCLSESHKFSIFIND